MSASTGKNSSKRPGKKSKRKSLHPGNHDDNEQASSSLAPASNGKYSSKRPGKKSKRKSLRHDDEGQASSLAPAGRILFGFGIAFLCFLAGVISRPVVTFFRSSEEYQQTLAQELAEQKVLPNPQENIPRDFCPPELLAQFLHDQAVPGLDLVCLRPYWHLGLYPGATGEPIETGLAKVNWRVIKATLEKVLNLRNRQPKIQPWALYTHDGKRIADEETTSDGRDAEILTHISEAGLLVVQHGGQWIWPGIRIGFKRTVDISYLPDSRIDKDKTMRLLDRNVTLETLSVHPLVLSVEAFFEDDEEDYIKEKANNKMHGNNRLPASESESCWLSHEGDGTLLLVVYRISSLLRTPIFQQEQFMNVKRYGLMEHTEASTDYFDPEKYKKNPQLLSHIEHGKRNRIATIIWYLTNVEKGGETIFPRNGLKVKPEKGKGIISYSSLHSGMLDPLSLRGEDPVKEGEMWTAKKWVWNKPMVWHKTSEGT